MKTETVPPYEVTECRTCKTKAEPLFLMQPAKDNEDFFCEPHRIEERKKRAEEG